MSVPTLDELVETFCELHFADSNSSEPWSAFAKRCPGLAISHREDAKRGLLAVLDRLKPVVAKACGQAMACAFPEDYQGDKTDEQLLAASQRDHDAAIGIATRIIDQIKGA